MLDVLISYDFHSWGKTIFPNFERQILLIFFIGLHGSLFQLLVTLRYLAKGYFFSEVGDLHGVSRSSVCRCIQQVISAINRNLNNITFPTSLHDLAATKQKFHRVAGIPNVVGAVDGTLIPIQAPSENSQTYVCRKGYHAVNIQAVVDSSLRFTNVNAKWPGSTHDATVFDNSSLKDHLATNKPGWLLGDSGYPLREYLITPKNNPQTAQELRFNGAHSRTRICVERAFGLLKARFRSGGVLPFRPGKCMEVVVVCAKLHNLCLDLKIPFDNEKEEVDIDEDPQTLYPEGNNQQCRQRIIAMF
ncbi:putative nuclease HARBI1 [Dreissena polymorpha]|uniref:putative nuclease HARBI1 n=1 Tax=Dreissena polymorpha TaxID=45954 RepID=UPI0022645DF5|nr:putative nuclease HARBI1 [Dreissena polymorpha]